ncbi:hypothetical protein, partial [Prevotella sp. MGM2]|uniref:hypothetical protein n=1 Tax=Prevotella sp. MGM2 TaxID=2033406 RepID=UPI001CBF99F7
PEFRLDPKIPCRSLDRGQSYFARKGAVPRAFSNAIGVRIIPPIVTPQPIKVKHIKHYVLPIYMAR